MSAMTLTYLFCVHPSPIRFFIQFAIAHGGGFVRKKKFYFRKFIFPHFLLNPVHGSASKGQ